MKITDLAILFIIIILPFLLLLDINVTNAEEALYRKVEINRKLEAAVEDGAAELVEVGGDKKVKINKENAAQAFLNSLYLNFNIFENDIEKKRLKGYIPCIVVIDYDGYYVLSNQEYIGSDGNKEVSLVWSPKRNYSYYDWDTGYVYIFTLDNSLTVYDRYGDIFYEGTLDQIQDMIDAHILWDSHILNDDVMFQQVRRRTIIEALRRDINYSINKHNDIARLYGITYNFTVPTIEEEEWYRTIDDVGMIAFFQGIPIGVTGENFNNFALGGARIVKTPKYYVQEDSLTNIKHYHREDCSLLYTTSEVIDTRKEAAKNGYLPCKECRP